jgi:ketopantoate reductase
MCPACIASTTLVVAGAGSMGGILAVCIGKLRKYFRANLLGLFQNKKGETRWQQARRKIRKTGKDIPE